MCFSVRQADVCAGEEVSRKSAFCSQRPTEKHSMHEGNRGASTYLRQLRGAENGSDKA